MIPKVVSGVLSIPATLPNQRQDASRVRAGRVHRADLRLTDVLDV
jgi:hypothetical protein